MRDFVLTRLAAFVLAVLSAALVVFLVLDLLPGAAGSGCSGFERFIGLFAGVSDAWQRLAVTLPLALLALAVATILGTALAWPLIRFRDGPIAGAAGAVSSALTVVPPFWLGMLLSLLFAAGLKLLPASGFVPWSNPAGALASLILPALALGLPYAGLMAQHIGRQRPGREARSVGRRILQALPPVLGRTFASLMIAAALVESLFYLPGLGRLVLGAAEQHDLILLRGGLFVLLLVAAAGMLAFTLLRLALEPELRR